MAIRSNSSFLFLLASFILLASLILLASFILLTSLILLAIFLLIFTDKYLTISELKEIEYECAKKFKDRHGKEEFRRRQNKRHGHSRRINATNKRDISIL